jgi:hypothetical protein
MNTAIGMVLTSFDAVTELHLGVSPIMPKSYPKLQRLTTKSMSGHVVDIPQAKAAYNVAKARVIRLCGFWTPTQVSLLWLKLI